MQHVAAGVVFAAVAGEVVPDIAQRHSPTATVVGFAFGTAVVLGLRQLRNRADATGDTTPSGLIAAVGVDVAIDGVMVGVGVTVGGHAGLLLTIALSLELPFLGLTVSAQILQNSSPRTAIATTAGLAALLPAGAVAGSAALAGRGPVHPRTRTLNRPPHEGAIPCHRHPNRPSPGQPPAPTPCGDNHEHGGDAGRNEVELDRDLIPPEPSVIHG